MSNITRCQGIACTLRTNCFRFVVPIKKDQTILPSVPYDEKMKTCEKHVRAGAKILKIEEKHYKVSGRHVYILSLVDNDGTAVKRGFSNKDFPVLHGRIERGEVKIGDFINGHIGAYGIFKYNPEPSKSIQKINKKGKPYTYYPGRW